ncbi:MAG: hypothetical protein FJ340_01095 [Sphingomonadales bacterium]|nr:hypothetical protein [Sphingomonadales bacterium]
MDGHNEHNEFEHFLKQNADAHRLYPSEGVWNRIHSRLHDRRRRTVLLLILLPLLTGMGWFFLPGTTESSNRTIAKDQKQVFISETSTSETSNSANNSSATSTLPKVISVKNSSGMSTSPKSTSPKNTLVGFIPANTSSSVTVLEKSSSVATFQTVDIPGGTRSAETTSTAIAPTETQPAVPTTQEKQQENTYIPTIESVVNSYQRQVHRPRFRWQLHFTPTVSYRTLQEDQKFIAQARMSSAVPAAAFGGQSTDLSTVVRHRPDIGMQVGLTGYFPVSRKIDWVAGIQFNVSKYDIEAYRYPSEVATIALQNPWGGTSTVSTLTSFRSNGFRSSANWLRNYYYAVSVPLGLQWRIAGKKHTHWGISATVQPTYVVGNRSYVISADYQNYAEVPYLINKWNLNAGFETYARFPLGKHDFRIGPQIRYQLLSSFKKGYPVQEHLYDFGIKLGMILGK